MFCNSYVPKKISVGKLAANEKLAILSCQWKDKSWTQLSKFARATGGFKPSKQLDGQLELLKHIQCKVLEFDNVPVSGFKLVNSFNDVVSTVCTHTFVEGPSSDICTLRNTMDGYIEFTVEDPRGFKVGISTANLHAILAAGGGNMSNFTFPQRMAYIYIKY